jgi:RNA polymerase sigma-70 factor (ECF subfamily)
LNDDWAQEIVQESMLEMFKVLGKLENAERFWPWLRGIAFNKIRRHHANVQRHRKASVSNPARPSNGQNDSQTALSNLVGKEIRQIVFTAMSELKPRHRQVLAMRCYEQMEYSEIAELMHCSELGVRVLFHRAKKSLEKALGRRGLGKGFLLTALVLFGKLTAPTEAAAAHVSVTAATAKVGVVAALATMAGSKTAVVSLATAGVLAAGTIVATLGPDKITATTPDKPATDAYAADQVTDARSAEECWYYFPKGPDGPVMMRMMSTESRRKQSRCAWRQNDHANYHFDKAKNAICINNYRIWRTDLGVWRLPTDSAELTQFLARVEGPGRQMQYVTGAGDGLLIITGAEADGNGNRSRIIRHHHILDEEYFRYDWPAGLTPVDRRDPMHKRGWTYFTINGRINEETVSGTGRLPFVYAAAGHGAWLRLQVDDRLKFVDTGEEALMYDGAKVAASFPGGSFFKGLPRPWMGLHAIDTVRRDAARQQVWFETKYNVQEGKTQVVLSLEQGKLVYMIDMQKDVIEKMTLSAGEGRQAELNFTYLQQIDHAGDQFARPRITRSYSSKRRESPGMLWLIRVMIED